MFIVVAIAHLRWNIINILTIKINLIKWNDVQPKVHNNSGDYCEDDHSPFKEEYGNKDNT